jgi:hypothetical protein
MPKSKLRGGAKAHRKRVQKRNETIKQKKIALTKKIIEGLNKIKEEENESQIQGQGV